MADDRFEIDTSLARLLVASQFPHWAALPIEPVEPGGWDNRTFRLGPAMKLRFPSAARYAAQVAKEHRWLPILAAHLPVPIPSPLAQGSARRRLSLALVGPALAAGRGRLGQPSSRTAPRFAVELAQLPAGAAGDPGRRRPRGRRPQLLPRRSARHLRRRDPPLPPRPRRLGRCRRRSVRLGGRARLPMAAAAGLGARRHRRRQSPRRGRPARRGHRLRHLRGRRPRLRPRHRLDLPRRRQPRRLPRRRRCRSRHLGPRPRLGALEGAPRPRGRHRGRRRRHVTPVDRRRDRRASVGLAT